MKAVVQRITSANVVVEGEIIAECGHGFLILLGVETGDRDDIAVAFAEKISKMRVFCDESGKMNLSLSDISGEAIVVSNFTLCADCSHGNRPSFPSAPPDEANRLYTLFSDKFGDLIGKDKVGRGRFGADMKVSLLNDGPVTLALSSDEILKKEFHRNLSE